jgi:hypothetical protein
LRRLERFELFNFIPNITAVVFDQKIWSIDLARKVRIGIDPDGFRLGKVGVDAEYAVESPGSAFLRTGFMNSVLSHLEGKMTAYLVVSAARDNLADRFIVVETEYVDPLAEWLPFTYTVIGTFPGSAGWLGRSHRSVSAAGDFARCSDRLLNLAVGVEKLAEYAFEFGSYKRAGAVGS